MGETAVTDKGAPQQTDAGQSSDGKDGTTSPQAPRTYTAEEVQKLISDERAEAGRKLKALSDETASLKGQVGQLAQTKQQLVELQERIEKSEMEGIKDNPELQDLYKQRKQLRAERQQLEAEKATHAEEVKMATETQREIAIFEIASETETDPVMLKELNLGIEETRRVAQRIGKQSAPVLDGGIKPDSGVNSGVGVDLSGMTKLERISYALAHPKKK